MTRKKAPEVVDVEEVSPPYFLTGAKISVDIEEVSRSTSKERKDARGDEHYKSVEREETNPTMQDSCKTAFALASSLMHSSENDVGGQEAT